jgi:ketosteroid isomerase-like protein
MTLNNITRQEIQAVMDEYTRLYNVKDERGVLALFSKNISGFGTARDEIVTNSAQFRKLIQSDLGPANAIRLGITVLAAGGEGPVAWVTGLCTFGGSIGGKRITMDGRVTAVLANHGGRWLFEQVHFSVPG